MESATEQICAEKRAQATKLIAESGVDLWLILLREDSDPIASYILDGHIVADTALIINDSEITAILGHIEMANEFGRFFDRVIPYESGKFWESLAAELFAQDPTRLALNYSESDHTADGLRVGLYRRLCRAVGREWLYQRETSSEDIIAGLRGVKSSSELHTINIAADITLNVADKLNAHLRPGITHGELRELFDKLVAQDGRTTPEFFIPTSGCIGKILRGQPQYRVEEGDSLILDMGVRYKGYTADFKRMWYFLRQDETNPPQNLVEAFDACRDVIKEVASILKEGVDGHSVDAYAKERLAIRGYDEYPQALGHQVGRQAHDGGVVLGPRNRYGRAHLPVQSNMVFTLEPGVKFPEHFPVGLEEMVRVCHAGPAEFLCPPQDALSLIR